MADAKLYRWEAVRAFHIIWFQQLEQLCMLWTDQEIKMTFHQALEWHHHTVMHHWHPAPYAQQTKPAQESASPFNVMTKPGGV